MTGAVDRELRLHHAYLVTENRILRRLMTSRMRLSGGGRTTLAEPGTRLGKPALKEVASLVTLDTILAWHRQLIAKKDDGSEPRQSPGRPTISAEIEALVVRLAWETRSWGDDRRGRCAGQPRVHHQCPDGGQLLNRHGVLSGVGKG